MMASMNTMRDWFASVLKQAESKDDAERKMAESILQSVKAKQGEDAYNALLADVKAYDAKASEREAAKAAKEAETAKVRAKWQAEHGATVLKEYPAMHALESRILAKMEDARRELNAQKDKMREFLKEHSATIVNDNGTWKVTPKGARGNGNGTKSNPTPRVGKIWVDGTRQDVNNGKIADAFGIPSQETDRRVFKTDYLINALTAKGHNVEVK